MCRKKESSAKEKNVWSRLVRSKQSHTALSMVRYGKVSRVLIIQDNVMLRKRLRVPMIILPYISYEILTHIFTVNTNTIVDTSSNISKYQFCNILKQLFMWT